jgi:hypothetical protein
MILDNGMILWQGKLQFRTYNPAKTVNYGILVQTVCESNMGYIFTLKFIQAIGKTRGYKVTTVCQMLRLVLQNKMRVYGTIRANKGLPNSLKAE